MSLMPSSAGNDEFLETLLNPVSSAIDKLEFKYEHEAYPYYRPPDPSNAPLLKPWWDVSNQNRNIESPDHRTKKISPKKNLESSQAGGNPSLSKRFFNIFSDAGSNKFESFDSDEAKLERQRERRRRNRKRKRQREQLQAYEEEQQAFELPSPEVIVFDDSGNIQTDVPRQYKVKQNHNHSNNYDSTNNTIIAPLLLAFMPIFLGVGTALGLLVTGYSFGSSSPTFTIGGTNVTVLLTNTVSAPSSSTSGNTNTNTNNITNGRNLNLKLKELLIENAIKTIDTLISQITGSGLHSETRKKLEKWFDFAASLLEVSVKNFFTPPTTTSVVTFPDRLLTI